MTRTGLSMNVNIVSNLMLRENCHPHRARDNGRAMDLNAGLSSSEYFIRFEKQ